MDSGYDTLEIKKYLEEKEIYGVIGYRRYQQGETKIRKGKDQDGQHKQILWQTYCQAAETSRKAWFHAHDKGRNKPAEGTFRWRETVQ